ncbi:TRAP transporter substrate-binding protein [Prochlorococcus sp. MIT 1307]|uniref:TRAP transporter substrate-binding protein n=1 Tax=Prochlorococcus sp. MIT 1307 TaxID=3096219 RepID=UPI002A75540C|nr:TRAP transporter substrate-binding protein [Prochlorococcus sp. MIT 1307]
MQRRKLLATSATALTAAVGTGFLSSCTIRQESPKNAISLPQTRWRMATSWPISLDTIYGGAETISERVNALSGGNFQIKPYAAGEIVPGLEVLDAVQTGSVECGHTASYYYKGKNPSFAFGTSVPFGLTAQQQNAWLYEAGGIEAMNQIFADFGVISFPAGNTGAQMGGWFKQKLEGLQSLQGLKMRIPGLGGEVMAELGVNVQVLPGGEVYLALDRGAIDAAEWTGPYDDERLGFARAARFYYYPGWWEPGPTLNALVNQKAWNKLPSEYKAIFTTACYEANLTMLSRYDTLNGAALQRLLKSGTELVPYEQKILQAAEEASFQLYADLSAKNPSFRLLFNEWQKFRKEVSSWNKVNEFSLSSFSYTER